MIINDIKQVSGCESNDGVEIIESVENLKKETAKAIFKDVENLVLERYISIERFEKLKKKWCD